MNGTEEKAQKQTHTNIVNWPLTKEQRQFNGETIEDSLFNNSAWKHFDFHKQKMNLNTDFKPFTKTNSKWITDLNEKLESIKLLDDNIGENLKFGDKF